MAIELATLGITVSWAVEATEGTCPTSGYAYIHGVKSIPDDNPEPNMIQVTPLEETSRHRYIPGLTDNGGALGLTCNDYDTFRTDWEAVMTAYATAKASGLAIWFQINVPGKTGKGSWYFRGIPSDAGFGGAEVDSVLEIVAYIAPNSPVGYPKWDVAHLPA